MLKIPYSFVISFWEFVIFAMKQVQIKRNIFFVLMLVCLVFCNPLWIKAEETDISLPQGKILTATATVGKTPVSLIPFLGYAYNLKAKDAKSALAQKNKFLPYDPFELKRELGTYWFLISFDKIKDKNAPTAYLDLGNFLPKNSHVLVFSKATNRWQVLEDVYTEGRKKNGDTFNVDREKNIGIFHSGLYDLTALRDGGELLIYSPGMPSIWFAPKLISPAKAPLTLDRRLTPFLMGIIFVLMLFTFWRGAKEEGDARIWASFLCLAILIQFIWSVPQNANGKLEYIDMIGVIASCLAIFFLPHIGRHLLVTEKKSPHFDSLLQFLAIPAIFPLIVLFVPIPEYLYIIRFAPLWGLYALVLFIVTIPFVLSGKKGARLYAFFCLAIGSGCLASLALRFNAEWTFINYAGIVLAMIAIFLAPRQTEKNVYDEKLNHEDIVTAFAENNAIMRDALYRVEGKLRDPFDRIMREACFLDFNLKTEDFFDSLGLLKEKEFGDRFEKHTLNAVEDLTNRAERLQEHTSSLVLACKDLSGMLGHITELAQKEQAYQQVNELFNIKTLVTQACDNIRAEAQDRQVGLGWYIAPNIGLYYRGDKANLELVLFLLLRDAIRATEKGMISIRVRRANSPNPGHIVITISDSGKGRPPVQRSILTLIKAWELSSAYNGEVELQSSPSGLSFSFSMQCLAMDQNGEKPLSYASLDDIVLTQNEIVSNQQKKQGLSGGNIVFSKAEEEKTQSAITESFVGNCKDTGILLISPLAIQRQNIAYYLNKYEIWEALDVDSALAFYEKKPAALVLVHSALTENGCNAVIAGIRLLEDNLGIAHAPCVGLYQSTKDIEFLQLAGCKHILPDNIGRDDLCVAVAEILQDKSILPITDVEVPHQVIKKAPKEIEQAVKKQINRQRIYVGTVVDGAVASLPEEKKQEETVINKALAQDVINHHSAEKQQTEKNLEPYEGKKGLLGKIINGFRPKPVEMSLQEIETDELVGEPQPISTQQSDINNNELSLENDFIKPKYKEQGEDISLLQENTEPNKVEQEVVENNTREADELVGEPQPISTQQSDINNNALSLENDFIKPKSKEQGEDISLLQENTESNKVEQEVVENNTKEVNELVEELEHRNILSEREKEILSQAENTQEQEYNAILQDNIDSYVEEEISETLQKKQEEDIPPQGLQLVVDNITDVETIEESPLFIQSGLVTTDEIAYEELKEQIEDEIDSSLENDEHSLKDLVLVGLDDIQEKKEDQEVAVKESNNSSEEKSFLSLGEENKEQQANITEQKNSAIENNSIQTEQIEQSYVEPKTEEHAIIDLSEDMLVETGLISFGSQEEHSEHKGKHKKINKKKHKKHKERKEYHEHTHNSGLDIMLDDVHTKEKKEDNSVEQKSSLDSLSFFPEQKDK